MWNEVPGPNGCKILKLLSLHQNWKVASLCAFCIWRCCLHFPFSELLISCHIKSKLSKGYISPVRLYIQISNIYSVRVIVYISTRVLLIRSHISTRSSLTNQGHFSIFPLISLTLARSTKFCSSSIITVSNCVFGWCWFWFYCDRLVVSQLSPIMILLDNYVEFYHRYISSHSSLTISLSRHSFGHKIKILNSIILESEHIWL